SKFIVDIITEDLGVEKSKVPFDIWEYGNTVSSSIPIILEKEMLMNENSIFLLSGFGVGLSWASCVLKRT
ncbi:MAG TPA: 3-oxoacyl-[acyl-carrier-protein] synthase III C-terminal domain-containing protein, partial [bacterium]|nr:3-oxoacyl-[acyl-carrier-protein] synthase III C-terminal domain-containing protein [bacterium]